MKTRNDFVSNSSSCSFIIGLSTKDDVAEFKRIKEIIHMHDFQVSVADSLADAQYYAWRVLPRDGSNDNKLVPGCFVLCDAGEDHDPFYEERYDRLCSIVKSSNYNFKIYQDVEAHMTMGERLPDDD